MRAVTAAALALVAGYWLLTRPAQAGQGVQWQDFTLPEPSEWIPDLATPDDFEPVQQLPPLFDFSNLTTIMDAINPTAAADPLAAAVNERAFLDMIAVAEGTANTGDRGYNVLFGGGEFWGADQIPRTFDDYQDHPRQLITRTFRNGLTVTSSAAGRYQFLRRTWDDIAPRIGLTDFSPDSQDRAALELIRRNGALPMVQAGRFADAVRKVRRTWASLPGAGYGQPEQTLERLQAAYVAAGGTVTA